MLHTNFKVHSVTPALSLATAGATKATRTGCRKTLTFFQARDITQREALGLQERQIHTMAWPFLDSFQALAVEHSRDFDFRAVRFQLILFRWALMCLVSPVEPRAGSAVPTSGLHMGSITFTATLIWQGQPLGLTQSPFPGLSWAVAGAPQPKALGLLSIKSVSCQGSSLAEQSREAPVKWSVQSQYK